MGAYFCFFVRDVPCFFSYSEGLPDYRGKLTVFPLLRPHSFDGDVPEQTPNDVSLQPENAVPQTRPPRFSVLFPPKIHPGGIDLFGGI